MKRTAFFLLAAALLLGAWKWFDHFALAPYEKHYSGWLALPPALVLLFAGIIVLLYALCNDNIHNLREGKVVDRKHTPAHTFTPPPIMVNGVMIPQQPRHVEADWAIRIQDERGRTGWLHFSKNIFAKYPVGSYYRSPGR